MAYEYKEPASVHTHRETVIEDRDGGSGWAVVLVLAVLVVLGLVGYFAFAGNANNGSSTSVQVETPAANPAPGDVNIEAPEINVEPPAVTPPDINIEPPTVIPPPTEGGEGL